MANAITTAVMAIASGDQNPLLTVTGIFVGLNTMGVEGLIPVGATYGVGVTDGVGVAEGAWVTVNVVVATSPAEPVAVTVYVPRDTDGTVKAAPALVSVVAPDISVYFGVAVPTFVW
jgi:hypothetical protein